MPRYALRLAYDGSAYRGWWPCGDGRAAGDALAGALHRLGETAVQPTACSRLDAGVHARALVAHIDCARTWDPIALAEALNHQAPATLCCTACAPVAADWDAITTCREKTYVYLLDVGRVRDPQRSRTHWRAPRRPGLDALRRASELIRQHDDFSALLRRGDHRRTLRTVIAALTWDQPDDGQLRCTLRADRCGYRLVRSLVGLMVRHASGGCPLSTLAALLAGQRLPQAADQAPARGLYLWQAVHAPAPTWRPIAADFTWV
ncbi:MAG: hypothetical protein ACOCYV_02385 [Planctomycetota bacterium]